jgi:hypothetical protein
MFKLFGFPCPRTIAEFGLVVALIEDCGTSDTSWAKVSSLSSTSVARHSSGATVCPSTFFRNALTQTPAHTFSYLMLRLVVYYPNTPDRSMPLELH